MKKIKSPTVESELFQISNNLELLFVLAPTSLEQIKYLDYSQFEKVHFLTVGEIIIIVVSPFCLPYVSMSVGHLNCPAKTTAE